MNKRVLFIDDDERILAGFRRNLHSAFEVETALGPEAGLAKVKDSPAFAVVCRICACRAWTASRCCRGCARCGGPVRVMLTGFADLTAAIGAVTGGIFSAS